MRPLELFVLSVIIATAFAMSGCSASDELEAKIKAAEAQETCYRDAGIMLCSSKAIANRNYYRAPVTAVNIDPRRWNELLIKHKGQLEFSIPETAQMRVIDNVVYWEWDARF